MVLIQEKNDLTLQLQAVSDARKATPRRRREDAKETRLRFPLDSSRSRTTWRTPRTAATS